MLDFFNLQLPTGANYQEFYGGGTVKDWVKPRGVAMARFLLIGAGASGTGGDSATIGRGGGSGAITSWIGPAIFIPDVLRISIGLGGIFPSNTVTTPANGGATELIYQVKNGTGYTLLTANGGVGVTGGAASANNYFGASGIYASIAGQTSSVVGSDVTAGTTFLSAGAPGGQNTLAGRSVTPNYGYPTVAGSAANTYGVARSGYFITQPVFVGCGGAGSGSSNANGSGMGGGNGGIGCGGGGGGYMPAGTFIQRGGNGGDGAAFVWSW